MHIESGPTGERKVRTTLMFLMVAVFAGWFAYDGWRGYPNKNRTELLEQLTPDERAKAGEIRFYDSVNDESVGKAVEIAQKLNRSAAREEIEKLFGGPPSFENTEGLMYFGPAMGLKIRFERGTMQVIPLRTQRRATDIRMQQQLAIALAVGAIVALWFLVNVYRTRLVLDDRGLTYRGHGPIGWDDMKGLESERFAEKGWVDLVYNEKATERKIRLDEYHLAAFDEIIDAICAKKGFANPLPMPDDKAQAQAS